jgi:hypothetical protein
MLEKGIFVCGNPDCRDKVTDQNQRVFKDPTCGQAYDTPSCFETAMRDRDVGFEGRLEPEIMTLRSYIRLYGRMR